jgi:hypothetical protein
VKHETKETKPFRKHMNGKSICLFSSLADHHLKYLSGEEAECRREEHKN